MADSYSIRSYWQSTPVYNKACLRFAATDSSGVMEIPLTLTEYKVAATELTISTYDSIPRIRNSNFAYLYPNFGVSNASLPKLQVGGIMQTPSTPIGYTESSLATPAMQIASVPNFTVGGNRITFGDYISMTMDGSLSSGVPDRTNPLYFRDGYGRYYDNPIIQSFNCTFTEGSPNRQQFTMTLVLTTSYTTAVGGATPNGL